MDEHLECFMCCYQESQVSSFLPPPWESCPRTNRTWLRTNLGIGGPFWLHWACSESECRIFGCWYHQPSTCQSSPPGTLVGELSGWGFGNVQWVGLWVQFHPLLIEDRACKHEVCSILGDTLVAKLAWGISPGWALVVLLRKWTASASGPSHPTKRQILKLFRWVSLGSTFQWGAGWWSLKAHWLA